MPTSSPRRLRLHQNPRPPVDYASSTLHDLVGTGPAVTIVEDYVTYPPELVAQSVAQVEQLVCPYPAQFVQPWFWRIPAGRQLAQAQWSVYQHEAVRIVKIARMLYGGILQADVNNVDRLFRRGILPFYHTPHSLVVYARRSHVLDVLSKNKHVFKHGQWNKAQWMTEEQKQAVAAEEAEVPVEDFEDVGRIPIFETLKPVRFTKETDDAPKTGW